MKYIHVIPSPFRSNTARHSDIKLAAGLWIKRSRFDSWGTLTVHRPSNGAEVKDVFGHSGSCVRLASLCNGTLAAHGMGVCQHENMNLETG